MKNTMTYALFLLLITGSLLTGCAAELAEEVMEEIYEDEEGEEYEEVSGVSEVQVEILEDTATTLEVEVAEPAAEEPLVEETAPAEVAPEASANEFADGTYFAIASYATPAGTHNLSVNMQIENDRIVWVTASSDGEHEESQEHTERFLNGLDARVVGVDLSELGKIGAINGSSLTAGGFSRALGNIESQAAL